MIVGRVVGWILVLAALVVVARDIVAWINTGTFAVAAAGELWFAVHPNSYLLLEPAISRHVPLIGPWLWHVLLVTVITWPAFLVIGVPGLALSYAFRRRPRLRRKSD